MSPERGKVVAQLFPEPSWLQELLEAATFKVVT
jgi:hypothetical protein